MRYSGSGALGALFWIVAPAIAETTVDCRREYATKRAAGEERRQNETNFVKACLASEINRASPATVQGSPSVPPKKADGAVAQHAIPSNDEASKESENPVTRWIALPLRYEADFYDGPYKLTKDTFEIDQAILPFNLNDNWALITRTKLPFVVEPPKSTGAAWESGLDNGYTTFFSIAEARQRLLLGRWAASVLSLNQHRDRGRQMGFWSVGGIYLQGRRTVGVWRSRKQYLVVRRRPDKRQD